MKHWIEYAAVVSVRGIVRVLPDPLVRAWGATLGIAAYTLDRAHRRVALANLAECFPNRPESERRAIARQTFRHFGQLLLELLRFSALDDQKRRLEINFHGLVIPDELKPSFS